MTTAEEILKDAGLTETEQHRGQLRFAERFVRRYGGKFLYVHGIGWHRFDGARWAECADGAESRAAVELIKLALTEFSTLAKDERKLLLQDVQRVESATGLMGMLKLAQNMVPCTLAAARLDASGYLLNTQSGTVDIEAGTLSKPNPSDYLSLVATAKFDPDARSEELEAFLKRILPDEEVRDFVARALGSALLGVVREHVLVIWYGAGANGKGTLRDAVLRALGDYAVEVPADLLMVNKYGVQNLAPERMRLKGRRVAFCSEIGDGAKLDEPTMKKLTGGDPVNAKLLYRNPIQFDPTHTLFMLTNHLPVVRGDDPAVWRRILAIPFTEVIPEGEQDGTLPERLKAVPDAVLAWLWRGWLDYQANGLNPPDAVRAATEQYRQDSDIVFRFLTDPAAVIMGHGHVRSTQLFQAFQAWCRIQGEPVEMKHKAFSLALEHHPELRKGRDSRGVIWYGVMLAESEVSR